jgi:hypothetical protein
MIIPGLTFLSNGCLSGILHPKGFYGRIGLATPKALEHYNLLPALRRRVAEVLADQPPDAVRYKDTVISFFTGRQPEIVCAGLFQEEPTKTDHALFMAARRMLSSSEPGIHRRVILGVIGVAASERVADLPQNIYEALLAEISREKPGGSENIASVDCTETPYHHGVQTPEGQHLVFSRALLEQSTARSTIYIVGNIA